LPNFGAQIPCGLGVRAVRAAKGVRARVPGLVARGRIPLSTGREVGWELIPSSGAGRAQLQRACTARGSSWRAPPHEVLTEEVDGETVGLSARWSGRGKETVTTVDRVGRTVVADRAVTARAGAEAGRGPTTDTGPTGLVRDPVRAAHRHRVGKPAPETGLRLGLRCRRRMAGWERGRRVGRALSRAAEEAAGDGEAGLVPSGDRLATEASSGTTRR
jgi:hypothetical protein